MKKTKTILCATVLLLLATLLHAQSTNNFPYEKVGDLSQEKLNVKELGGDSYVLVVPGDDTQRYFAVNLPDSYKKDGLNLICSGIVGKPLPNARMIGTPLQLKSVKVGKNYKKYKIKVKSFVFE